MITYESSTLPLDSGSVVPCHLLPFRPRSTTSGSVWKQSQSSFLIVYNYKFIYVTPCMILYTGFVYLSKLFSFFLGFLSLHRLFQCLSSSFIHFYRNSHQREKKNKTKELLLILLLLPLLYHSLTTTLIELIYFIFSSLDFWFCLQFHLHEIIRPKPKMICIYKSQKPYYSRPDGWG